MLSFVARPASRLCSSVQSSRNASTNLAKSKSSLKAPTALQKSEITTTRYVRFYAGHGHHEEAPKPYKRTVLSPLPADASKSSEEQEREVQGIEGWIFGRKVTYLDPLKPIEDTPEQVNANGWLWNQKPRVNGQAMVWEDWEPLTYIGTALAVLIVAIGIWAKPETNIQVWATEEARERKIIKARRELRLKEEEQQASL